MTTETRQKILDYLEKHSSSRVADLVRFLGISNQALHRQLNALLQSGFIERVGKPPRVFYSLKKMLPPDS